MSRVAVRAGPPARRDEDGHLPFSPLPIRPVEIAQDSNRIESLSLAQRMHPPRAREVLP